MTVAIFGGTFNPIHSGHLIVAREVLEQLGWSKVIFVPAGRPWMRKDEELEAPEAPWEIGFLPPGIRKCSVCGVFRSFREIIKIYKIMLGGGLGGFLCCAGCMLDLYCNDIDFVIHEVIK